MKLVNVQVIKDELERLIRNYRFYSSTEAKYRYEAYKELSEWMDNLDVEEPSKNLEEAAWTYYDKNKPLIPYELDLHKEMISFFIAGAKWAEVKIQAQSMAVAHGCHKEPVIYGQDQTMNRSNKFSNLCQTTKR